MRNYLFDVMTSLIWASFLFSFALVFYAFCCIGRMRMFQKAGVPGWKAWVPVYSDYVLCKITMGRGWYFLFGLIPVLVPVMRIVYAIEVTLSYGQSVLFGVLYVFLPNVAELILGFGDASYCGSQDLDRQVRTFLNGGNGNSGSGSSGNGSSGNENGGNGSYGNGSSGNENGGNGRDENGSSGMNAGGIA